MFRTCAVVSALSMLLAGCGQKATTAAMSGTDYDAYIRAWQKHRDVGLRAPDGWLTLVGLFWLSPSESKIGCEPSNDFVLPKNAAPPLMGSLKLSGGKVLFTNLGGSAVTVNGKAVAGPVALSYDEDKPDIVRAGTITFVIIKRQGKFAVRARDIESPVLKNFKGIEYFPIDAGLHFPDARFISDVKKIPILDVTGQVGLEESPGVVEFEYKGQTYRLRPIYEGKTLFFLFKDPTNKTETYQAERMMNTPLPANGKVNLDFNRAYNPPCTFTPYATCPLPPKENNLPFPVTAGEKRYGSGHPEGYGSGF
jgi:uncharacterized protein (DUF1684 family)